MRLRLASLCLAWALLALFPALSRGEDAFTPVTGPCGFTFPRDHGPHPGHKTEWWYYTGSLAASDGRRFGFQFTIFRSQLAPSGAEKTWPDPPSAWRSNQIMLGHAALTDVSGRRHVQSERVSRQALGLAGWEQGPVSVRFFLGDWNLTISQGAHALKATGDGFSFELALSPQKGPVAHGNGGYSLKGSRPESASCYYSFPRLSVSGSVTTDGKTVPVTGQAWMDHEYSSAPLEQGISGWDWFSLRLTGGWDLMVFFLRTGDGFAEASSGTLIAPDGTATHLPLSALKLASTSTWTSPRSQARYPAGWKLAAGGLELEITPEAADQEMNTQGSTGVNYWEGLVRAKGTNNGEPVTGEGHVELTGYDKPFTARY